MPAPVVWVYSCGSGDDIDFYHETCLQLACLICWPWPACCSDCRIYSQMALNTILCVWFTLRDQLDTNVNQCDRWTALHVVVSFLFVLNINVSNVRFTITIFSPPLKIYHWIPYKHSYQKAGLCCWLLLLSCDMSFGWQSQYWVDLLWDLICCNLFNPLSFDILILLCLGV